MMMDFIDTVIGVKIYVLYHKNCSDGLAAGYSAWKRYGDRAEYIEVNYGEPFPNIELNKNDEVYILDFCYDLQTLLKIKNLCKRVLVIDHHEMNLDNLIYGLIDHCTKKSKIERYLAFKLAKWCKSYFLHLCKKANLDIPIFNINYSGATLAWLYFNPNESVPDVIKYVTDRDLWKFKLKNTKAFHEGINASPFKYDYEYWDSLVNNEERLNSCIKDGQVILRYRDAVIKRYKKYGSYLIKDINGLRICFFNALIFYEEIAEAFYNDKTLNIDYTVSYYFRDDGTFKLSFRTNTKSKLDLRPIAKRWGGGGHKHSSAASLNHEKTKDFLALISQY